MVRPWEPGIQSLLFPAEHLFIQTFWQTMNREWKGIDKLRLDKYYMVRSACLCLTDFKVLCAPGHGGTSL